MGNPGFTWLSATLAGLIFELLLISSLNIALAVGVLASGKRRPLRGALCGIVVLAMLGAALLSWRPVNDLRIYARCVEPRNGQCELIVDGA